MSDAADPQQTIDQPPAGADPFASTQTAWTENSRPTPAPAAHHLPPDAVPGFTLLDVLGQGGGGVVYRAMQQSPDRLAAIKILLHGRLADDRARRRFEREVDLAASLKHPHIVGVYDGGVTPEGLPFLAMEYVPGETLDVTLARPEMKPLAKRLDLFVTIARAVGHAHQRGVIHRDLKPSNIRIDPDGEPHLLDFGLAKAVDEAEDIGSTRQGEFAGTLAYAAPEQAAGDVAAIDTRSDVYALGAMLYEVVSGRLPIALDGSLTAMLTAIQSAEPMPLRPPTRRLFAPAAADALPAVPGVDDRLDAVIMKCLNKDRAYRYRTAGDLADDVARWLAGEPVTARPPTTAFLVRRWLRNHLRASLWTVVIGVLYGVASGLAVGLSAGGELIEEVRASYAPFPSEPMPWFARAVDATGAGHDSGAAGLAVLFAAVVTLGWATVSLVRPRTRTGLAVACVTAGTIAGVAALICGLGWAIVTTTVVRPLVGDFHAEQAAAASLDPEVRAVAVEKHPDLARMPAARWPAAIADKLTADLTFGLQAGIVVCVASPLLLAGVALVGGLATAWQGRRAVAWWRRSAATLEVTATAITVAVWFVNVAAGWAGDPLSLAALSALLVTAYALAFPAPVRWLLGGIGVALAIGYNSTILAHAPRMVVAGWLTLGVLVALAASFQRLRYRTVNR